MRHNKAMVVVGIVGLCLVNALGTLPLARADDLHSRLVCVEQAVDELMDWVDEEAESEQSDDICDLLVQNITRLEQDLPGVEERLLRYQEETDRLQEDNRHMRQNLIRLETTLTELISQTAEYSVRDCSDEPIPKADGIHTVKPPGHPPFPVHCQREDGHIWTVIQQRFDATINFNRTWEDYKGGFGEIGETSNYWVGLERIYHLTSTGSHILRVTLEDWEGNAAHSEYTGFHVDDEEGRYRLRYSSYLGGSGGDALGTEPHRNQPFSTPDNDNDITPTFNCASYWGSGWWFYSCFEANLNGIYQSSPDSGARGIQWFPWKGSYSLKAASMKIRRTT